MKTEIVTLKIEHLQNVTRVTINTPKRCGRKKYKLVIRPGKAKYLRGGFACDEETAIGFLSGYLGIFTPSADR